MDNKQKSKEYWEKRARENENKVYAKGSEVKKALEEHYLKARKEIRKSVSELVARYMDKTELSYMEAVKNLTSSEFKEWRMTLEEYEEEIQRLEKISPEFAKKLRIELETLATKSRITRLDSLNTQIDIELAKKSIKDYDVIRDGVSKTYSDFFKIQTTEFGLDGANTVLPKKTIEMLMQQPWSGSNFSERIWDNSSALARVLKQEIIQAFMQGVSVKDLSDRIEKRFENDRYNTERLVRTELNYALNQSTKLSYDEAGIKEYEFLAEIDSRTSDICRELNGKIFKMKDARVGVNYPPMHPHCRSTTIPVMNYEDIKTRKTKPKSEDDKKKEKTEPIKNDIIKEKTFVEAKTIEEANQFAIEKLGINANYKGIDIRCANEWNEGLLRMKEKFPEIVKEGISFVGATQERNILLKRELIEYVKNSHIEDGHSEKMAELLAKKEVESFMMKFRVKQNNMAVSFYVKSDNNPTVEVLRKANGITMNNKFFNDYENAIANKVEQVKRKWKPIGCDTIKGTFDHEFGHQIDSFLKIRENQKIIDLYEKLTKEELKENLSGYSTENIKEFIAESWSEYVNNPNPREISKTVGSLIEEEWEKWKTEKK